MYAAPTARPTFTNCDFDGGSVPRGAGGAIYLDHQVWASFDSCSFNGNPTAKFGPMIYAENPDSLLFQNSTFYGMRGGDGAQIVIKGSSAASYVLFKNCTFKDCGGTLFDISRSFAADKVQFVLCQFGNIEGGLFSGTVMRNNSVRVDSIRIMGAPLSQ